ncbi:uncharacterized protein AB675_1462 [Cyphellophora attinorum]|uniref:CPAF-like PDZ domain-containing protein n=1 Tax=Cyphellophora attinorum TaxID=1664694 RepID=A0A0N0NJP7_9EURO|nr:uncharacterized protein AB675_1462 [Phialophora attinorum]KPI37221.1 hypothetical protein AB675_1462 [Phialophora attinorum]
MANYNSVSERSSTEYWREPYDLIGNLDTLIEQVNSPGFYLEEYTFESHLYKMFARARDGHLRYTPAIQGLFAWGTPTPLVSISDDGASPPQPYVYSDILLSLNDTSFTPTPIVKLYGNDAEHELRRAALWSSMTDQDAAYNMNFVSLAQLSLGPLGTTVGTWAGGGRGTIGYPGPAVNMTFGNGTTIQVENFARVLRPFSNITDGEDVRNRFLNDAETLGNFASDTRDTVNEVLSPRQSLSSPAGYPPAVAAVSGGAMGGYFLDGTYENTAVLSVASFLADAETFLREVQQFLQSARASGKSKLIIDLSANAGGFAPLAELLFQTLFPDIDPWVGTRFRATPDFNLIGALVSDEVGTNYPWPELHPPGPGLLLEDFMGSPFVALADMNATGGAFKSWEDKFGPHDFHGDRFTSVIQWNLSDPFWTKSGYDDSNLDPDSGRPFAVEDIIMLTDGYCASTCASFVELMTIQAGVKTVAAGGQKESEALPMQAIGGVRGANVYPFQLIWSWARDAMTLAIGTAAESIVEEVFGRYSSIPMTRAAGSGGSVNSRDGLRLGDIEQIPLQFRYQKADCHIYYQKEHVVDVSTLWKSVWDVTWGGHECAEGSINMESQSSLDNSRLGPIRHIPHQVRVMSDDEIHTLREAWRYGTDVNKLRPMGEFQSP